MPLTTLISALSIFAAAVLSLFEILTGNPQWAVAAMALMRAALTIAFYPLVVLFCHHGLTLRRLSPGDVDPHGVPR